MLKKHFIVLLILFSMHCFSQESKIDSIIVTTINCNYDSLENKSFYSAEREFESCSDGLCHYKNWNYGYFPDTSLVYYQYDFTSAKTKEKLNIFWDHSDPHFQEVSFYFEKYYADTKKYKSLEILEEKEVYRAVESKDTLMARNVKSRREHGYMPEPFYLSDSYSDTTITRISIWLKVIDVNGEQSLKKSYYSDSAIFPEIIDSIDGQTNYNLAMIRGFFSSTVIALEDMKVHDESKINLDSDVIVQNYNAIPSVLYTTSDKKRPSYLKKRNKHFHRIKKEKNFEIWEYSYGDDCNTVKYEIY